MTKMQIFSDYEVLRLRAPMPLWFKIHFYCLHQNSDFLSTESPSSVKDLDNTDRLIGPGLQRSHK